MSRLDIPRNSLVILIAPAGAGKSLFALKHFKSSEVVSSDECRSLIADDPADQSVTPFAFELLYHILELRLSLGRLTVVDATNLTPESRLGLLDVARKHDFNAVAIVLKVSLSTCLERNKRRERRVPESAITQQYSMFEDALQTIYRESFGRIFVVDESDQDLVSIVIGNRINLRPAEPAR